MDRLNYTYRDGTNQLWSVQDGIAAGAYAGDIDNQGGSNYSYDRIGNLIGDVSENISQVNWTVYGKIGNIQKKQAFLGYVYNAGGERVVKQYLPYATNQCLGCDENTGMVDLEVYERNSNTPNIYKASKTITFLSEYTDGRYRDYSAIIEAGLAQCTPQCAARPPLASSDADFYIRDATGNVLAVYHYDRKTSQLRWSEQHLYGSARLGMYLPEKLLTSVSTDSKQREVGYLGKQVFELSNHLGNVLATITDKKLQVSTNTTSTAYFEADVQTVQDYYAFGMQMPGRKLSGGYRYGFNGKENDNEVKGEGNQIDYGLRIYDPRIIRFLSVDPLFEQYPWYTPYQFAGNSPIANVDIDGGEEEWYKLKMDAKTGKTELTLTKKKEERSVLWGLVKWTGPETKYVEYNNSNYTFIKGQNGDHDYGDFNAFVNNPDAYLTNTWHSSDEEQFEEFAIQAGAAVYFGSVAAYRNIGSKSVTTPRSQKQSETPPAQQNKPAVQQKAATDVVEAPKASVNKNSNDADGNYILYDIHQKPGKQGQLLKVGKADAERTRADGTPVRMSDSQRKARQAGYPEATATVRKDLGKTTTGKAKIQEAQEVRKERANGNRLPLNKEKDKKYKG